MEKSSKIDAMNVRGKLQAKQKENAAEITKCLVELNQVKDEDIFRERELNCRLMVLEESNNLLSWVLDELLMEILQKTT